MFRGLTTAMILSRQRIQHLCLEIGVELKRKLRL